ncbi:hypothetical protein J1N35_041730 [Gossypium stocksii]|uniref:Uncharacterized protein n=1 Tax=Gossypium stocksii TaxID=47602 RepID=A0A9D3ZJJ7_9ROSI|nr:hypothetical protein J1N35_041730 [Gossypium stocksii]
MLNEKLLILILHCFLPFVMTSKKHVKQKKKVSQGSFDKFQLYYLSDERRFQLIEKGKIEVDDNLQVHKGDNLKWYPSKEGGIANNLLPLRTICGSHVLGNDFVKFMNKGVRDDKRFFASKWPDLRTNHPQEGGHDAIPVASCYDTTRHQREWPKLEGLKCKMKLDYKLIQLTKCALQFIAN